MATGHPMTADRSLQEDALKVLDGLKRTAEGTILHGLIARGLRKFGNTRVEAAFLAFADKLLERYLVNPASDPSTRMRAKMIQLRLRPYVDDLNAAAGTHSIETAARTVAPEAAPVHDVSASEPSTGESLPEQIARQMAETLARGRDLDGLLRASLATLDRNSNANATDLKQQLARGINEMLAENRELERQLKNTSFDLQHMAEDHRQLAQALDHARKHSLTDELTGLPNRSAFLRQLDAEIGRARRYGFSLALALIDVDGLKDVNARYGESAGDAVLHAYANEVMAQFRGYDMVARYGNDEFAVIMPNTQKEGASRAMEKAQKHAASTYIQVNGHSIPLPSFSNVLTVYSHGEPPATLLQRADDALTHAKRRGRGQAVVALPAG
jgi:diguanylate cyclase (GGDEF)-like protein